MKLHFDVGKRPIAAGNLTCDVCGRVVEEKDVAVYIVTPAAVPLDAPIRTWGKYFEVPPARESCHCVACVSRLKAVAGEPVKVRSAFGA